MSDRVIFDTRDPDQGISRELADGLNARVFFGDAVMISVVRIEPGKAGAVHAHPEEQWGYMIEGTGIRLQDGIEYAVRAGDLWQTPGQTPHGFCAGSEGAVILDIFSPPRPDYRKPGSGFGTDAP